MEEKNNLIASYIDKKVKDLDAMSMYVPKESVDRLLNAFLNCEDDIEVMKTKIDTIFENSVSTYKASLEKMGSSYQEVMDAYEKIVKMNKTKVKLYLSGGVVPYVLLNENSKRKHTNLNLICSKDDARMLREVFRKNDLYEPKRDSLTYTTRDVDYGFQVVIDDVRVDIALYEEVPEGIIQYSFDYANKIGRTKNINAKLNEYIVPYVASNNKKYMMLSLEFVVADKLLLKRDKDKKDIEKIAECNGISEEKIKKLPLPLMKEEKLMGNNLEFTSTMPRIKLELPKKQNSGFISFATILLIVCIVVCIVLGSR